MALTHVEGTSIDKKIESIAFAIKTLRKANGYTQEELAAIVKIERSNLAKFETGKLQPTLQTLIRICEALHCDLSITFNLEIIQTKAKIKDGSINSELFSG